MLEKILALYNIKTSDCIIQPFGSGLINNTWKIVCKDNSYILQRINQQVFKIPEDIDENIEAIATYLCNHFPDYLFISPVKTAAGKTLVLIEEHGYFRLFPFMHSVSYDVVTNTSLAFEAAKQFGKFTKLLSDFPESSLHITIHNFHNLTLRYEQFETALNNGNSKRIKESKKSIDFLQQQKSITDEFENIVCNKSFRKRVIHHDTKISNVLFDEQGKGLCIIDLDTVMPGYFISDMGDMMRTYLSPVSEEEKDFSKIIVRENYFEAIVKGYLEEMGDELSDVEINHLVYSGKFMIYMQALRFLADYINNDVYYGAAYEKHNFVRAQNQIVLLQKLLEKEDVLNDIVKRYAGQKIMN
jgi:Ser/Thr protein kinase RdoA (MazF antagonist)